MRGTTPDRPTAMLVALLVTLGVIGLVVTVLAAAPAAGQATPTPNVSSVAGYYNDSTTTPDPTWLDNRSAPTLANVSYFAVQSGAWIFGSGDVAPGGVGLAGPLLVGLVVGGALLGSISRERVGPVAGGVLAVTLLFGLTAAAVAPGWLVPVGLFVIGLLLTVVIVRALP